MTIRALEKEILELPARSRIRVAEKIIESIEDFADATVAKAWETEIGARVRQIESGSANGIPAKAAKLNAKRALNETRRLSSARRK